MCGITGIYSPGTKIDQFILSAMTKTLYHRGPDDLDTYIDTTNDVGLGHTRLSIIDLSSKGKQPMSNSDGSITASYNGEIYNYRELRELLKQEGHSFISDSDTEVVVKAYEQWGMDCLHRFIGMFALAIWDARKETLFLIRDRAGVKPLYYYKKNGLFLFASELRSMMQHPKFDKKLNTYGLSLFLKYNYIRSPHTIFENTFKLEPGHYISVRKGEVKNHRYWNVADYHNMVPHTGSEQEIADELEKILIDSFKYRLVSDVPVGLFLSGGIDSSIVATLLQKNLSKPIKTFTIGFNENKYNEAHYAKRVAEYLGTDHTEHYISEEEALEIVPKLPSIYDEPFGDNSIIPTYLVSEIAKKQVKVALSADGGDELFCGYEHYAKNLNRYNSFKEIPQVMQRAISGGLSVLTPERFSNTVEFTRINYLKRFSQGYAKKRDIFLCINENDMQGMFRSVQGVWKPAEIMEILDGSLQFEDKTFEEQFRSVEKNGILTQMLTADFSIWLPDDILTKVDRASMSVGLESREPFLDHRLVEFTARIPSEYKYRNGETKYILKKLLERYLPREMFDRRKMGFSSPVNIWLGTKLRPLVQDYLNENSIRQDGFFKPDVVTRWVDKFYKNEIKGKRIWNLLVFQMWKEQWL